VDLRQLRYFVEIVEQTSLTRAAARLNVAQPALSIHLRNMEEELGTALVVRGRNGVTTTEAGQMLLAHARRIISEQNNVEDEIRNLGAEPKGQVRIGLPGTIGALLTVPLIEAAQRLYPKIRVTISEAMSGFVIDWLREGHIDFGIVYTAPADRGIRSNVILKEEVFAVSQVGILKGKRVDLPTLAEFPLILPSRSHGLRTLIDTHFGLDNKVPTIAIEIDSFSSIKALVARGHGISLLPMHAVAEEIRNGQMQALPIGPTAFQRNIHVAYGSNKPLIRSQSAIYDLIRDLMTEMAKDGRWPGASLDTPGRN
jgi:LysR family nitrogen assimilation transcriptional regulator